MVLTAGSVGLEVDTVLLVADSCIPTGDGSNCSATTSVNTPVSTPVNTPTGNQTSGSLASTGVSAYAAVVAGAVLVVIAVAAGVYVYKKRSRFGVMVVVAATTASIGLGATTTYATFVPPILVEVESFTTRSSNTTLVTDAAASGGEAFRFAVAGQQQNCALAPSACGYPDATNTGPAAGTTFTRVPQDATAGPGWEWKPVQETVTTVADNAVLSGLDISGTIQVKHANAIIENSRVTACGGVNDGDVIAVRYRPDYGLYGPNAIIRNNTIQGTPAGCDHRARSAVRDVYGMAPGMVITANDMSGVGNGITVEYEGVITDNWIHDLGHITGDHHSGISTHGGANSVLIRHNTALLSNTVAGLSAALTIYSDFNHAQNTTLEDNLVDGGSYTMYGGDVGMAFNAANPATNIKILNNRLVCGNWIYGPLAFYTPTATGNEFTGNYCDQDLSIVTP